MLCQYLISAFLMNCRIPQEGIWVEYEVLWDWLDINHSAPHTIGPICQQKKLEVDWLWLIGRHIYLGDFWYFNLSGRGWRLCSCCPTSEFVCVYEFVSVEEENQYGAILLKCRCESTKKPLADVQPSVSGLGLGSKQHRRTALLGKTLQGSAQLC